MSFWNGSSVAEALGVKNDFAQYTFTVVETDTRSLQKGALFVALSGERFDGHDFLDQAKRAGATAAVVRRGTRAVPGLQFIEVADPLLAYGKLARYRRRYLSGPVVAVTGTNGKTSTKEFIRAVLSNEWRTYATRLNNNNRVGVPLTILEAPAETEALVVEAGANQIGEINHLRQIIEPTVAVITNVAAGHLSGFRTQEGVFDEKLSLLPGVPLVVVGENPPDLVTRAGESGGTVLMAGLSDRADVRPTTWGLDDGGLGSLTFDDTSVHLSVPGSHQVTNATMAMAVGFLCGLESHCAGAMADVTLPHGRCEILKAGSCTIVNDTYNANPASLDAALELAAALRGDRKLVIVVGTMLELGAQSELLHQIATRKIVAMNPDIIGVLGDFAKEFERIGTVPRDRLVTAPDAESLGRALRARLRGGELVLLKASRGVGLERAIPHLHA